MEIIKDEYGYIFKDEDISDAADATAFACAAKRKPITNADRIRAMTDEELAGFLEMIPHCGTPPIYTTDGFCIDDGLRTKRKWLDWLRQEAT